MSSFSIDPENGEADTAIGNEENESETVVNDIPDDSITSESK